MQIQKSGKRSKSKKSLHHECCEPPASAHPDHTAYLSRLNRVTGQISGIERMISDRRYCVDILIQFRAVMAALRAIEVSIFETHLQHCVNSALLSKDKKEVETKIRELSELLSRRSSL